MLLGCIVKTRLRLTLVASSALHRLSWLLAVTVTNSLNWCEHINTICATADRCSTTGDRYSLQVLAPTHEAVKTFLRSVRRLASIMQDCYPASN